MTIAVSLTEQAVNKALGNFLTAVIPSTVEVVVGEVNRVAEPQSPDYVVMWPLRRPRLATNIDTPADAKFTGAIAGAVMTITQVFTGELAVGSTIFGTGVADNSTVQSFGTGTGGAGTYNVSPSQTVPAETLSAGTKIVEQPTEAVYQLDVHGPNSGDNSQIIATLFRDGFAVQQMAGTGVTPLYADDPKQVPFRNAAGQTELRWTIDLHMQINPALSVPTQYADRGTVAVTSVTEAFPA